MPRRCVNIHDPYVHHAEYLRDTSSVHDIWAHQGPWAWASSISGKHRREPTACIGDSTHRCFTHPSIHPPIHPSIYLAQVSECPPPLVESQSKAAKCIAVWLRALSSYDDAPRIGAEHGGTELGSHHEEILMSKKWSTKSGHMQFCSAKPIRKTKKTIRTVRLAVPTEPNQCAVSLTWSF